MAKVGAPRKYKSAGQLRRAIEAYWASISYEVPAVISTPTGEVDSKGTIKYKTKLLTEAKKPGMNGAPITVTKFLEPPSEAAMLLYIGVRSRSTWAAYKANVELAPVVEEWRLRYEAYLAGQLERGKHVSGVMFNLEHNFGWRHKADITGDGRVRVELSGELEELGG